MFAFARKWQGRRIANTIEYAYTYMKNKYIYTSLIYIVLHIVFLSTHIHDFFHELFLLLLIYY